MSDCGGEGAPGPLRSEHTIRQSGLEGFGLEGYRTLQKQTEKHPQRMSDFSYSVYEKADKERNSKCGLSEEKKNNLATPKSPSSCFSTTQTLSLVFSVPFFMV